MPTRPIHLLSLSGFMGLAADGQTINPWCVAQSPPLSRRFEPKQDKPRRSQIDRSAVVVGRMSESVNTTSDSSADPRHIRRAAPRAPAAAPQSLSLLRG